MAAVENRFEYEYRDPRDSDVAAYLWPSILKLIPSKAKRICEIGCGNGSFSRRLSELGHAVTGFDSSRSGIEQAERTGTAARFEVRSVADELPEAWAGAFELVVSIEVIEHLLLPRQLARCAWELLAPGGTLIVSTPYHGYLKNLALAITDKWDAHHGPLWDFGHVKFFSEQTLRDLLEESGFERLQFRHAGRLPFLWKSMIAVCQKPSRS